jgi:hypothetical protein
VTGKKAGRHYLLALLVELALVPKHMRIGIVGSSMRALHGFPCVKRMLSLLGGMLLPATICQALPVFPGAIGFGTDTPAGRGGQVYRVTSLADDGPGSLRHGVEGIAGPRVIVFEVSGVIRLKSDLIVRHQAEGKHAFLTIAGQTAPAPGITLAGAGLSIQTHDILVQHIAIRPGDRLKPVDNRDCIKIGGYPGHPVHHVVIDHVSCSWSVDETVSTWSDRSEIRDVTFSSCIFSEPVINGGHSKGSHPYGALGGRNTSNLSLIGNLMAFNFGRNPLIRDETGGAQVVNNFIYRPGIWSNGAIYIGDLTLPPHAVSVIGNVIVRHPVPFQLEMTGTDGVRKLREFTEGDYRNTAIFVHNVVSPQAGLFLHDNRIQNPMTGVWHPTDGDAWNPEIFRDSPTHPVARLTADPYVNSGGVTWAPRPADSVEKWVLASAGQRPAWRDALDATLIEKIRARTGSFLQDLEGDDPWAPADIQNTRPLTLPENPPADDDDDGYTNLEEWLHRAAAEVERSHQDAAAHTMAMNSPVR